MPRREFLRLSGLAAAGVSAGALLSGCYDDEVIADDEDVIVFPVSAGYLLVDPKKCQGCMSCMLACSLVNEGVHNFSLARIQVTQNSFAPWPDDLALEQCRQCVEPHCIIACNYEAAFVDQTRGNIRAINPENCVACGACVAACPYQPKRPLIAMDNQFNGRKSRKCDLCANAPYHFAEQGGGPGGVQACVSVCPIRAITFVADVPIQTGDEGYQVDLRDETWQKLGFPDQ